jgi:hypothetical protein
MITAFARWYWARVKEFPLVVAAFTLGCLFEAVLLTVPPVLRGGCPLGAVMTRLRTFLARRKLQRIVERTRDSYERHRYRERRAAALKGSRRR